MVISISVQNIKCGGCASSIDQKLMNIEGVESVNVDVEAGKVECVTNNSGSIEALTSEIKQKLLSMGYPEQGSVEGLKAAGAKAKSFVSCAVGKMSK